MEKTNFTFVRSLRWILPLLAMLGTASISAQTMACNDNVQVSVDPTANSLCEVELTADMVLEAPNPNSTYLIQVMQGVNVIYSGVDVVIFDGSSHLGQTLTVKVTDQAGGNSCWGSITVEDKADPVIFCNTATISCLEDYNNVPFPDADDNCDLFPDVQLTNVTIDDSQQCSNNVVTVTRSFIAIDASGNESAPCNQIITITRPDDVDFPNDILWECDAYDDYPNITAAAALHPSVAALQVGTNVIDASGVTAPNVLANTGSGLPSNVVGQYCNYAVNHADQVLDDCGSSFKIIRTWTVLDWCTGSVITTNDQGEDNVQIVKVIDTTDPVITMMPFDVSANIPGSHPQPCKSQDFLPAANVSDNCNTWILRIFTPVGEAIYINGQNGNQGGLIPAPGLPLGFHTITYQATDECGNVGTLNVQVEVVDDIAPTTICDEITDVAVTSDGMAIIPASVFDDGSYDNCCLDEFLVRRMNGDCDGNFDDFGPTVKFCCTDIADNPIMVVFRAVDCYGNFNDCMVEVEVEDKLPPFVSCPANATVDCHFYLDNLDSYIQAEDYSVLDQFGSVSFGDNCEPILEANVNVNINTCQEGTITRTWTVTDPYGNGPVSCTQTITVTHVSDWVVEFPADVTGVCEDGEVPDFGEPEIYFDECELIGTSFSDQFFYIVPDACYKIVRTWTVINWCIYDDFGANVYIEYPECNVFPPFTDWDGDGDSDCRTYRDGYNNTAPVGTAGTPDGYIEYEQVIKVIDEDAPVFDVVDFEACIIETDCDTDVTLPTPDVDDCSTGVEITVFSDDMAQYATGNQYEYADVPPGEYQVFYEVIDDCGNISYDDIIVTVKDCKLPTPYCVDGLVIEIMQTGMIDIWAVDFDAGSFDNCPGDLKLSFSPDVNDDVRIYTCDDLGENTIQLWVTDAEGNQDFCETFVVIQDNLGHCNDSLTVVTVAGAITDENDNAVQDVNVELSGNGMISATTDGNGAYSFANVPMGGDYSVTPMLDTDHDNGVTTFDLVLITKHILQVDLLDSPYKVIAADANNSQSVTTTDMVEIRKVILQVQDEFSNNTSWRFVAKDHIFADAMNPWGFPEVISYNNLDVNVLFADFYGVKVGDVNGTASTGALDTEDRNFNGTFVLNAQDKAIAAGEEFTVEFTAEDLNVLGYQFTLNFNESLELVDLVEGVATADNFGMTKLSEGAITVSWNDEAKEGVLFGLTFRATAEGQLSEMLNVNSRFTKAEAYNANGELLDIALQFNGNEVNGFALYQNTPNPFNGATAIGFNLPETGTATLTINDISGRTLKVIQGEFVKGYNEVRLNASELSAVGVLYYTLETADATATRKMVIVK
jgi:hypothetical protein